MDLKWDSFLPGTDDCGSKVGHFLAGTIDYGSKVGQISGPDSTQLFRLPIDPGKRGRGLFYIKNSLNFQFERKTTFFNINHQWD